MSPIETYLAELTKKLNYSDKARVIEEISLHLYEAKDRFINQGLTLEEAETQAIKQFGSSEYLIENFTLERKTKIQKILVASALILGLSVTYLDSSPGWDDTGISAGLIVIICACLAVLKPKDAWLWALLVGGWIPLWAIIHTHNYGAFLALLIAFVGAYLGAGARQILRAA